MAGTVFRWLASVLMALWALACLFGAVRAAGLARSFGTDARARAWGPRAVWFCLAAESLLLGASAVSAVALGSWLPLLGGLLAGVVLSYVGGSLLARWQRGPTPELRDGGAL